mgnify:CR=1 FL=1
MILSKTDLKEYLLADRKQLGITRKHPRPFTDEIWKYEITLRKYEYWSNQKCKWGVRKFMTQVYKLLHHRNIVKLGIGIGPNCCGKGLSIAHNLRIQEGVTIGAGNGGTPTIGNNVYLGSGCKVIGNVKIADDCVVGANAVVTKDVVERGITVAGVPAKKISSNNSFSSVFWFNDGRPC